MSLHFVTQHLLKRTSNATHDPIDFVLTWVDGNDPEWQKGLNLTEPSGFPGRVTPVECEMVWNSKPFVSGLVKNITIFLWRG